MQRLLRFRGPLAPFFRRSVLTLVGVLLLALTCARHAGSQTPAPFVPLRLLDTNLQTIAAVLGETISNAVEEMPRLLSFARHGTHERREPASRAGIRRPLHEAALPEYLERVRTIASYAHVTSTFNDWRPPSGLRPCGGLHNGYDIGLDAGTTVPCGWPGRVTKIQVWWGEEHGITVETNNIEVTYGHLIPTVKVGDQLQPGDIVGRVARNHVDIKMHCDFGYIDWGKVNPFNDPLLTELHHSMHATVHADVLRHLADAHKPRPAE